ncbi:MAG: hypothetical protein ACJ795_23880 [Ktedonobacteraceae bacterium]
MQQNITSFPVQPCPVCGADSRYRVWKRYTSDRHHRIASKKRDTFENVLTGGSPVIPLICTKCGYVQHFVNPGDFQDEVP